LDGLPEHLAVLKNEHVRAYTKIPPMNWLAVEDFNTKGLRGDPLRTSDPPEAEKEHESFYWFWRNVGRSGKSGNDLGRWGLGKTVFPATSAINAMFGLTIRADDHRTLLMGQAVTKQHNLGEKGYQSEAFFHCAPGGADVQEPIEDHRWLSQFCDDFQLKRRKAQSGLSVVVPYAFQRLRGEELLRSVIVHYFASILRKELIVEVDAADCGDKTVDHDSIRSVADGLAWDGRRRNNKKHTAPPFDFYEWAVGRQRTGIRTLSVAGQDRAPNWGDYQVPEQVRSELSAELRADQQTALRIPLVVSYKDGGSSSSYFDVFLRRDPEIDRGDDYFVREGMTIAGISTLTSHRGYLGLVLVDDGAVSTLLGDCEGPAHNDWGSGEATVDAKYALWKSRVSFVKNSLARLATMLAPAPGGLDVDLLKDIFWLPEVGGQPSRPERKPKPKPGTPPELPPEPPLPAPRAYRIEEIDGGFKIVGTGKGTVPQRLIIDAAYDVADGNPLRRWSPFDFSFEKAAIRLSVTGGQLEVNRGNRLEFVPEGQEFEIQANGFDSVRDLLVNVRPMYGDAE
jgi:hypothetical protein